MSKSSNLEQRILSVFPYIILVVFAISWFICYRIGLLTFNKNNAVTVFSSVIQGMSALLSVAIAVAIFRIQSLENRNQSLEQSTLNYIFQITAITYPQCIPRVENAIKSGALTNWYYNNRLNASKSGILPRTQQELEEDRNEQQKRLEETLNLHTRIEQTIQRMKNGVLMITIF